MARLEAEQVLQQSVLDKLIDLDPKNRAEAQPTRAQSLRQLKAALRRDLEWLLNSRRNPEPAGESTPELSYSVYNYGLADITSLSMMVPDDQQRLSRMMETAIARYEPRLQGVVVTLRAPTAASRVLRFQIEGMLRVDPAPEHVSFDTLLELASAHYQVEGEQRAR
jgi:type VI secretion system protein ImpF